MATRRTGMAGRMVTPADILLTVAIFAPLTWAPTGTAPTGTVRLQAQMGQTVMLQADRTATVP
jgi:hypothetical protein